MRDFRTKAQLIEALTDLHRDNKTVLGDERAKRHGIINRARREINDLRFKIGKSQKEPRSIEVLSDEKRIAIVSQTCGNNRVVIHLEGGSFELRNDVAASLADALVSVSARPELPRDSSDWEWEPKR